jgi:hypothetical protein
LTPELSARIRQGAGPFVAALFGAAWFLWAIGGRTILSPTHLEPLFAGDWSTHVLGWLFFRNERFAIPLGKLSGLLYPVGTTVGFTDSIPWVALVLRPFSSVLPADFQYIGAWLLLCFILQGAVAARLVALVTDAPAHQALGGALLVAAPTLRVRIQHTSLTAHALLLAMIWLNLRACPDRRSVRRSIFAALVLNALAAGIHPYLAAMVAALTVAFVVRLRLIDAGLTSAKMVGIIGSVALLHLGMAFLLGYLGGPAAPGVGGFGIYSADLLTFFNPYGYSRWLPVGPTPTGSWEGSAYLGMGALLAGGLAAICVLHPHSGSRLWPWARAVPLLVAAVMMAIFALSWQVRIWGHLALNLQPMLARVEPLFAPFRASGRFIWPLHYTVVAGSLLVIVRTWRSRPRMLTAVLASLLAVQLAEVAAPPLGPRQSLLTRYESPVWSRMEGQYRHLALFPAEIVNMCNGHAGYRAGPVVSLAYLAYRHHLTFNSGYVARWSSRMGEHCATEIASVTAGTIDPETVYVVSPEDRELFTRAGSDCGTIDGLLICVRPRTVGPLAEYIRTHSR